METLNEKVFKRMGWKRREKVSLYLPERPTKDKFCTQCGKIPPYRSEGWEGPDKAYIPWPELPQVSSIWESCAEYVVPFAEKQEYYYQIIPGDTIGAPAPQELYFMWKKEMEGFGAAKIINHDLANAACRAFMDLRGILR